MKTLIVLAALAFLPGTACLADPFTVSLTTGAVTDTLVTTPILNGFQFTYQNLTTGLSLGIPPTLTASDSTFLATYVLTGGIGVLNVTDVCAKVDVNTPLAPCQQFAFSFTNLTLGNATVISTILNTNISASGNVASFFIPGGSVSVAADVALGGGQVDFTPPMNPVPEPGTLGLVATGLLGAATQIRKRLRA